MSCPDENTLVGFAEGGLPATLREKVEQHIDACAECAELVAELARDSMLSDARTAVDGAPSPEPSSSQVQAGMTLGRYVLIERIGAGGMGQVWAAYDPELDRRIALKLLRPELAGDAAGSKGRVRLMREAKAMAKVSHPNVITVHDVGTVGDHVFVAMELVPGPDLKQWLKLESRSWASVVAMFLQAGEGLAAAHAAGLVHRDFKPSNVIVGEDQIARVLDFGLARGIDLADSEAEVPLGSASMSGSGIAVPLTATGVVMGTPAYMAPEQFRGADTDARTDQYNFCVALWEGLYGRRPFSASTFKELGRRVVAGKLPAPPAGSRVPGWLHRALARGLSVDPQQRFVSMQALLHELRRVPRRRRIGRIVALAVTGFAGVAGVSYSQGRREAPAVCTGASDRLAGVWDEDRKRAIADAFEATQRPYAASSLAVVHEHLDDRAREWERVWTEACEATHIRGEQSEKLLDLRMACLDERLREVDALARVLSEADATAVERAPRAVQSLPGLDACGQAAALRSGIAPPDPTIADAVAARRDELARAHALRMAGSTARGLELARQSLDAARSLDYAPLLAEALERVGDLEDYAGDPKAAEATLHEALLLAESVGDDELAAKIWTTLIYVLGIEQARYDEAERASGHAGAKIDRLGEREDLRQPLLTNRATLLYARGQYDDALATHEKGLELLPPERSLRRAGLLDNLGSIQLKRGDREAAARAHREALRLLEEELGPQHPGLAGTLGNLSVLHYMEGHFDEALASAQRGLALLESDATGPTPFLAKAVNNLANIHAARGEHAEALTMHERALEMSIALFGEQHPSVAMSLDNIGSTQTRMGHHADALGHHQRALAIREATDGPEHPSTAYALQGIGDAQAGLGRLEPARAALERAMTLRATTDTDPGELAQTQFSLAKVLWAEGSDRDRARRLAEQARELLASSGGSGEATDLATVVSWLATRSD